AHPETTEEQLPIACRGAAQCREAAPHGERGSNDRATTGAVGKIGQRHCEHGIKNCESESADSAELGIGEIEVLLDRLGEDAEDLPVEEVEDVGEQQQRQ